MDVRHELGRMAEDRAAEYVRSLGWEIKGRNVRNEYGELDIVAFDKSPANGLSGVYCQPAHEFVIIEVRCRTIGKVQSPIDSIGPHKLQRLIRAGEALMSKLGWSGYWRIDVIGFTIPLKRSESWKLEHVRDITAGLGASG